MEQNKIKWIDKIDQNLLDAIFDWLVKAIDPLKIILFGSHAYGNPDNKSDLDLCIVVEDGNSSYKTQVTAYQALTGILIPFDIRYPDFITEDPSTEQAKEALDIAKYTRII